MTKRPAWQWSPATIYAMYASLRKQGEDIMADLSVINSALRDLAKEISTLKTQVEGLEAGSVTQAELDQVAADITAAAEAVDAIIEDASEQPHPDQTLPGDLPA
jgi:multidrug resistance efflux pump